jgi:hypothetical protein
MKWKKIKLSDVIKKKRCNLNEFIWICSPIEIQNIIFEFSKRTKTLWLGRKPSDLWNVL